MSQIHMLHDQHMVNSAGDSKHERLNQVQSMYKVWQIVHESMEKYDHIYSECANVLKNMVYLSD